MKRNPLPILIALILVYFGLLLFGDDILGLIGSSFSGSREIAEVLGSLTESLAIIVAGYWAYNRFIKERGDYPFPKIEHQIKHWDLENGYFFVRVYVVVENKGKVKHDLSKGAIFIRQVKPCNGGSEIDKKIKNSRSTDLRNGKVDGLFMEHELHKIAWPELGYRDFFLGGQEGKTIGLEPTQTKIFPFDFLIEDGITHIEVISYLDNQKRVINCLTDPPTSTVYFLGPCSQ